MRVNWFIFSTLFRTELRMALRDRRILLTAVVLPMVLMPLMFLGSNWAMKKREWTVRSMPVRYAVAGSQADRVRSILGEIRGQPGGAGDGNVLFEELARSEAPAWVGLTNGAQTASQHDALATGQVGVVIEGLLASECPPDTNSAGTVATNSVPAPVGADSLVIRLVFRADRDVSSSAAQRMEAALGVARDRYRSNLLWQAGSPLRVGEMARIESVDLATKGQVAGLTLGRLMPLLLLLFVLSGGAVVAMDLLAGEKERGTLETLLTTGAGRLEIILAKHCTVFAVGLIIAFLQSLNLLVYAGFKLLPLPGSFAAAITPGTALILLGLFLPVAATAASGLLLISGRARTYREAQLYFFPVFLIGMVPALAAFLPGLELQSAIVLVPVAGLAVGIRDVMVGSRDWLFLAVAWLDSMAFAGWLLWHALKSLGAEKLITAADTDSEELQGGAALFPRRVWRWYVVMWALLVVLSNYFEKADLRVQLAVNLVGIFFAGSALMLWRYRLDAREALSLRWPHPAVWLGVLVAVPGGVAVAVGLFKLSNLVLPIPESVLETFNTSLLPAHIPFWQLLLFLAVMPAVFEEIAFRGLLLHGLRARCSPVMVAVVTSLVFAVFHVTLFRFVPTAFLGLLLAATTLLSRSILPSMLWHALSNATSVCLAWMNLPVTELDAGGYATGAGLLATGLYILWRHRSPV